MTSKKQTLETVKYCPKCGEANKPETKPVGGREGLSHYIAVWECSEHGEYNRQKL